MKADSMSMLARWLKMSTRSDPGAWPGAISRAVCALPLLRQKDGAMIIETAFVLPTFFLLLFGIFQISLMLTAYCSAAYAVRTAARYGSVHSSSSVAPLTASQIQSYAQSNFFAPGMASGSVTATYTTLAGSSAGNLPGSYLNVSITWSQKVNMMSYHSVPTLTAHASRVILR